MAGRLPTIAIIALALAGCAGERPFVSRGDAATVEIGFSRDLDATLRVARQHCGQFERVPELTGRSDNIAYYECRKP